MSDSMGVALVSGGFGLVNTAIYVLFLRTAGKTRDHIKELADNTNSKMDRLLEVTGQAEFQKGIAHEKERQK